ncbi:phosphopantetheine-binding protein [Streptomyces alkaliphilus]|nr:phosphopantetheine-binding protein [Streptomyces alkaliphilus]
MPGPSHGCEAASARPVGGSTEEEGALMSTDVAAVDRTLAMIWTEVLGEDAGSGEVTFFEAGGESISATLMVSRIEDELDVRLEVGDIFEEDPDLSGLRRLVTAGAGNHRDS